MFASGIDSRLLLMCNAMGSSDRELQDMVGNAFPAPVVAAIMLGIFQSFVGLG